MFRALRRNAVLSVGSKRWFSSTNVCKLLACQGVVAGTATQASFKPLTGRIQVEYAKSGHSNCAMCGFPIADKSLRIGTFKHGKGNILIAAWQHPRCFRSMTLKLYPEILRYTDKDIALKRLSSIKPGDRDLVTQILTDDDSCTWSSLLGMVLTSSEIEMIDQQLAASALARKALAKWKEKKDLMTALLNANISPEEAAYRKASKTNPPLDSLIGNVSSLLLFGPTEPCEVCNVGDLVPHEAVGVYRCRGRFEGRTGCEANVAASDIRRTTLNIPPSVDSVVKDLQKELNMELPFDKQIILGHVVKQAAAKWREQHGSMLGDANGKTYRDLTFFTNKTSLQDKSIDWGAVTAHGGVVTEKYEAVEGKFKQDGSQHFVTTTSLPESSIDRSLPIVSTKWIQESAKVLRPLTAIEGFTYYEVDRHRPVNKKDKNVDDKPVQLSTARGGTSADNRGEGLIPKLAETTHSVYRTNDLPWSATFTSKDKSYLYILQLLQTKDTSSPKTYVVFRYWGRLDNPDRDTVTHEHLSEEKAKSEFAKCFKDRTGHEWKQLTAADPPKLQPKPGRYSWRVNSLLSLPTETEELMKLLFNSEAKRIAAEQLPPNLEASAVREGRAVLP